MFISMYSVHVYFNYILKEIFSPGTNNSCMNKQQNAKVDPYTSVLWNPSVTPGTSHVSPKTTVI